MYYSAATNASFWSVGAPTYLPTIDPVAPVSVLFCTVGAVMITPTLPTPKIAPIHVGNKSSPRVNVPAKVLIVLFFTVAFLTSLALNTPAIPPAWFLFEVTLTVSNVKSEITFFLSSSDNTSAQPVMFLIN